jgi:hypothetical protein
VNTGRLVFKEIVHRKLSFAMAAVSVAAAAACLVGALALLDAYDLRTHEVLQARHDETARTMAKLEDDMRKAMLNLGFNIVILPKDQKLDDWYLQDSAPATMPEEYAQRLLHSKIVTVQHLLPCLQQKVKWPERRRNIILVGTRGEVPGATAKSPMVQAVPQGTIVLGHELHDSLGLKVGDRVTLMGREFTVHRCYSMRGDKDDITAWIHLSEAQELLDQKGRINAILALECKCAFADLAKVRQEITAILPGTQVIERGSEALARAEVRQKAELEAQAAIAREVTGRANLRAQRERLAAILVPLVMLVAGVWVALLAWGNVRQRRSEIGVLRALGVRTRKILVLLLSRAVIVGLCGGVVGVAAGWLAGRQLGASVAGATTPLGFPLAYAGMAIAAAVVLSAVASWIPAMLAAQQDPAAILHQE